VICVESESESAAQAVLNDAVRKMERGNNSYRVLLGDADGEDAELFNLALSDCQAFALAHRASSVAELVNYLAGTGKFVRGSDFCAPDVVLLDLNFSGPSSGFEVLKWIQSQATRLFRVVVLSAGGGEKERERAYALGADGFVTKPRSVGEMIGVLTRIEGWLRNSAIEEADEFCAA